LKTSVNETCGKFPHGGEEKGKKNSPRTHPYPNNKEQPLEKLHFAGSIKIAEYEGKKGDHKRCSGSQDMGGAVAHDRDSPRVKKKPAGDALRRASTFILSSQKKKNGGAESGIKKKRGVPCATGKVGGPQQRVGGDYKVKGSSRDKKKREMPKGGGFVSQKPLINISTSKKGKVEAKLGKKEGNGRKMTMQGIEIEGTGEGKAGPDSACKKQK